MTDTEAVLDTARYLREVRPIDPEEIYEYVDGQPHPAVVRQTLREHAFELGLKEREDGAFVPVEDGTVHPDFTGVERFPEQYARQLESLLVDRYGAGWPDSDAGDRLREHIDQLKVDYFADADVTYDEETALAYALYHLPDYYAAIQYVLDDLGSAGLLGRRLRVLDVGAGTGGPMLGIHEYLPEETLVDYDAVEPSAAADVFEQMASETRRGFEPTLYRETAESFSPDGDYDLIVFANVLSELSQPAAVFERYLDHLADDGTVVAVSPAEERTATRLRDIEREVLDRRPDATVYAPTIRLWPDESPSDRGWTFTRQADIEPPAFQTRLDAAAADDAAADGIAAGGDGTYTKTTVQYAYLLLRTDGRRAIEYTPDPDTVAKMADMDAHVTDRIDLAALKLSPDLSSDGNPLYKISDGSEAVDHYAVLTRESSLNRELPAAPYGSLLRFENVLVLWNDDEDAYNLVVDDETVVDRLA
ncbi:probable S-adenosylmethionine-dependent methyltransferase [Natronomonas pharaonis DSM 2160]|uniref:Probable S-adenosylmethionine-dependent methyltransferase n=1 Tax=Natronomonas pharaonis (strain ATCC 35678 / DSM 2160 / CIP 103997 / JCM 8858 / NBRC 14720 / NCIMB 2260 / Gabara) TaxID=348780 RepID=A0A1U7EX66_NATPD|nr:class I SAM-dependent methyltransferase [Natronomonas pharaonis]CAI49771.1 probable S-adenosylmethionine-dependent methyltransferase [Natronomonas pharaonis DSM 2160]